MNNKRKRRIKPTEEQEQIAFVERAQYNNVMKNYLWAITNDEKRSKIHGRTKVRMGLKKGVSDLFLAYPVYPYHGLFIEMKSYKGTLTLDQLAFLQRQAKVGYATHVAYSADHAWAVAMQYLDGKFEQKELR